MITLHFHLQPQYKYELFHINFTLDFIHLQIKLTLIWMVVHQASLWWRGLGGLGNGLFKSTTITDHQLGSVFEITWLSWLHLSPLKRKAGVFKFLRFEERLRDGLVRTVGLALKIKLSFGGRVVWSMLLNKGGFTFNSFSLRKFKSWRNLRPPFWTINATWVNRLWKKFKSMLFYCSIFLLG